MQTGASPVQAASISVSSCIHPSCPAVFRKLCFYGGLHPSGSYDLLQVSLKGRPHDLQQIPTQNELSGICGASFSIACSDIFFSNLTGPWHTYCRLCFCALIGLLCVGTGLSLYLYVWLVFLIWPLFLLFSLSYSYLLIFLLSYFIII